MSEKIELKEKLAAIDLKAKSLWDDLDDDQKKALKNEFFLLNRYASSVKSNNRSVKEDYILAVNEYFNKYWNDLQKHPKLMWQLLSMCGSETKQVYFHEWIGFKKKDSSKDKLIKFMSEIYPQYKNDELELLSKMTTKKEAIELARDHGYDEKEISKMF